MRLDSLFEASVSKETRNQVDSFNSHLSDVDAPEFQAFVEKYRPQLTLAMRKYAKGIGIFRGDRSLNTVSNAALITPGQRKSQNTTNYYTLWMSNHESWSDFPRRDRSAICSSSYQRARSYGSGWNDDSNAFLIVPMTDTKIGVCSDSDLWQSWLENTPGMHSKVMWLMRRLSILDLDENDWNTLASQLKALTYREFRESYVKHNVESSDMTKPEYELEAFNATFGQVKGIKLHDDDTMYEIMATLMNPYYNEFTLTSWLKYDLSFQNGGQGHEVWFSAPYLAIKVEGPKATLFPYLKEKLNP